MRKIDACCSELDCPPDVVIVSGGRTSNTTIIIDGKPGANKRSGTSNGTETQKIDTSINKTASEKINETKTTVAGEVNTRKATETRVVKTGISRK